MPHRVSVWHHKFIDMKVIIDFKDKDGKVISTHTIECEETTFDRRAVRSYVNHIHLAYEEVKQSDIRKEDE